MLYEMIERRLDIIFELAWDREFPRAYAELDRLLEIYPNDFRVHDAYAQVLEDEVYSFSEGFGRYDEKLRKARKCMYFVLRHCMDVKSAYVYRAIYGLAGQARVCGKRGHELRLEEILQRVYGKVKFGGAKCSSCDSAYARSDELTEEQ